MPRKKPKRGRPVLPLDERHYLAIELLTTVPTPNLEEIAQACGVSRRQLYTWRQRKDFTRELVKVQRRKTEDHRRWLKAKIKYVMTARDIEETFRMCGLIA
ncbi:phBC6A51 family helix-turn-helix protein [Paenibacillus phoenicis]|uniref:PhBC6A51 family helix-turn-helix protein n=1 Tax=Paenibacillus phoenicis TaxID=554117 RepID=A0ABU5PMM0_9BACL|nr:phBC6A51 family helix-turn-helix protein [Paenibacillus phoenicis]MEA3570934.1 phBC6A51 family helix-turn-helix protein [Paenibacillus phoenicis]